jgi:glycosyltransferase involved in cell wall biosynthesis
MTICLAMIVKNEAHCISNCLNSVKPFIDYWIICDTGSTDNTEETVKSCYSDIPGEYHHNEWVDFSTNRNIALQLAKASKINPDYILVIDADDYLVVSSEKAFQNLDKKAYNIEISHGSISYSRVQLFSSKIPSKYVGVLHEYLEIPPSIIPTQLTTCKIIYGASGARSHDPNKYLHDAEVLTKAMQSEPNNSRYVFYAAQSYRDAKLPNESLKLYLQRSKMGGWVEEQYVSFLEAGKLYEQLQPDDISGVENLYIAAHNCQPNRAESLVYLSSYCRRNKLFDKSYFYSKIGSTISKPHNGLFIEQACYDWKIIDELAIAAYWIGKKQEAASLNLALLTSGMLPQYEKNRVIKNLSFCENQPTE